MRSIASLVDFAAIKKKDNINRNQTDQLMALAAILIFYLHATKWAPSTNISTDTRKKMRDLALHLGLEVVIYENYSSKLRVCARKMCEGMKDNIFLEKIQNEQSDEEAIKLTLELFASLNIYTAAHIGLWSRSETCQPLDLTRKIGDPARLRGIRK